MAHAILSGLQANLSLSQSIVVSDVSEKALATVHKKFKVTTVKNNTDLCEQAECILLAVKPQNLAQVCSELKTKLDHHWILSIVAGVSIGALHQWLERDLAIVRAMPNLGAQVQSSMTALVANAQMTMENKQMTEKIFSSIGHCFWLDKESDLHAVTALSGSGPSYFFHWMQAMITQGITLGLEGSVARQLVVTTALGSARVVTQDPTLSLATLIEQVCSKGGTTEAAMKVFQANHSSDLVQAAVQAAYKRSVAMSKETAAWH